MKSWLPLLKIGAVVWAVGLMGGFVYLRGGGTAPWAQQSERSAIASAEHHTTLPGSKGGVLSISSKSQSQNEPTESIMPRSPSWSDWPVKNPADNEIDSVHSTVRSLDSRPRPRILMSSSKSGGVFYYTDTATGIVPDQLPSLTSANGEQPGHTPPLKPSAEQPALRPERTIVLSGSKSYFAATTASSGTLQVSDPAQDAQDIAEAGRGVGWETAPVGQVRSAAPYPRQDAKDIAAAARALTQEAKVPEPHLSPERINPANESAIDPAPTSKSGGSSLDSSADHFPKEEDRPAVPIEPFRNPLTLQPELHGESDRPRSFAWSTAPGGGQQTAWGQE